MGAKMGQVAPEDEPLAGPLGRLPKLTYRQLQWAARATDRGWPRRQIAGHLGVAVRTLTRALRAYRSLQRTSAKKAIRVKPPTSPEPKRDPSGNPDMSDGDADVGQGEPVEAKPAPTSPPASPEPPATATDGLRPARKAWIRILAHVERFPGVLQSDYDRWLKGTRGAYLKGRSTLVVAVPTDPQTYYLEHRFGAALEAALTEELKESGIRAVEFEHRPDLVKPLKAEAK